MTTNEINWGNHFTFPNADKVVGILTESDVDILSQLEATKRKTINNEKGGSESIDYTYVSLSALVSHFSDVIDSVAGNPVEQLNELKPFFGTRLWRCDKTGKFYMNAPQRIRSHDESHMVFQVEFEDPSTLKGIDDNLALMSDSKAVYKLKSYLDGKNDVMKISEDPNNFKEIYRCSYQVQTERALVCGLAIFHRDSDCLYYNGKKIENANPDTADFSKVNIGILNTGTEEIQLVK